jgi:hypothetical protein
MLFMAYARHAIVSLLEHSDSSSVSGKASVLSKAIFTLLSSRIVVLFITVLTVPMTVVSLHITCPGNTAVVNEVFLPITMFERGLHKIVPAGGRIGTPPAIFALVFVTVFIAVKPAQPLKHPSENIRFQVLSLAN